MNLAPEELKEQYASALRDYVAHGEEAALQVAFELGRTAIMEEPGVLDIAEIHHEALSDLLREIPGDRNGDVLQEACEFLMQAISPFEMTHRGFQQSNARLHELNETLERRVEERTRELQRRSEDLRRSNEELEKFAYVASHDLQEPLRMVSSYTQLLARRYKDQLDEDAEEFIGYAVDGAERMQTLINELLKYSRVGTQGKELTPTDCEEVLKAACANLKIAMEESESELKFGSLPTVVGDQTQLIQLFQNLIGNAIKFRREGVPPEIEVSARESGGWWIFSVSDNGIGIEAEYVERIFVIFQRLHGRVEYPGTGIGLALCKKIVERHGGTIRLESAPGEGSTFHFSLPSVEQRGEPGK